MNDFQYIHELWLSHFYKAGIRSLEGFIDTTEIISIKIQNELGIQDK